MSGSELPFRQTTHGLLVSVRLTPKGGRDSIDGLTTSPDGAALKARVRAAPEDGEANAALIECFAKWLGVPKRSVAFAGGQKSRSKVLSVSGDPTVLGKQLQTALASLAD